MGSGYIRFADATVLTGRNDSGKTRLLGLIETALNDPTSCGHADLFGIVDSEVLEEHLDREAPDGFGIKYTIEAVQSSVGKLEPPDELGLVRIGVRLYADFGVEGIGAFRVGASLEELEDGPEGMWEGRPYEGHSGDRAERLAVEYLGRVDESILPEAVVVPSPPGR